MVIDCRSKIVRWPEVFMRCILVWMFNLINNLCRPPITDTWIWVLKFSFYAKNSLPFLELMLHHFIKQCNLLILIFLPARACLLLPCKLPPILRIAAAHISLSFQHSKAHVFVVNVKPV